MKITKKIRAQRWQTIERYEVEGISNETDAEIIRFCDPNSFGGYVYRYGNGTASVDVNID